MLLSVIIPSHQKVERLMLALHSYLKQSIGLDRFEIVVIADGCSDGTMDVVRSFEDRLNVQGLATAWRGQSASRNLGARLARGRLLAFMDDDVLICPDYLERCADEVGDRDELVVRAPVYTLYGTRFFRDPESGRLYPEYEGSLGKASRIHRERVTRCMIVDDWPSVARRCYRLNRFERLVAESLQGGPNPPAPPWVGMSGSGVVVERNRFLATGGYDEAFALWWGAESLELGCRLWQAGAVFRNLPEIYSAHLDHPREAAMETFAKSFDYFAAKHPDHAVRQVERLIRGEEPPRTFSRRIASLPGRNSDRAFEESQDDEGSAAAHPDAMAMDVLSRPDFRSEIPVVLPHFIVDGTDVRTVGGRPLELPADHVRLAVCCDGVETVGALAAKLSWPLDRVRAAIEELERRRVVLRLAGTIAGPSLAQDLARHVVIAPHIDDAALSLGGTLALEASRRPPCEVWTVFSQQSFQTGLRVPLSDLARIAEEEEKLAGRCLNFRPLLLGLAGAQDRHGWPIRRVMGFRPEQIRSDPELEREFHLVCEVLTSQFRATPAAIVHAPLGVGGHLDHVLVNMAVDYLWRSGELGTISLSYYEDLPYAASSVGDSGRLPLMDAHLELTDVTDAADMKRRALSSYHTRLRRAQIDLCMNHALRLGVGRRYCERAWRMRDAPDSLPAFRTQDL